MSEFYVAVLARNSEGEVFATVPDLPGANSAAPTTGEALKLVIEFANDYVRDLVESGDDVPKARALDAIPVEPEDQEIGRALIPVEVPGKSVKISISIDTALLERADRAATANGMTRSGYIADSLAVRLRDSASGGHAAQRTALAAGGHPAPEPFAQFRAYVDNSHVVIGNRILPVAVASETEADPKTGARIFISGDYPSGGEWPGRGIERYAGLREQTGVARVQGAVVRPRSIPKGETRKHK